MADDPFIQDHDAAELEVAGEFLTNWLPFLRRGLCDSCSHTLADRIRSLRPHAPAEPSNCSEQMEPSGCEADPNPNLAADPTEESSSSMGKIERSGSGPDADQDPIPATSDAAEEYPSWSEHIEPSGWGTDPEPDPEPSPNSPKVQMSWADMAQEDELAEEEERAREKETKDGEKKKVELTREQREWIRFKNVGRKKDFICLERVKGKIVNILDGLELHTGVFSAVEQKRIVDFVYELQEKGRRSEFRDRTYSEPQKWMRGKGRVTIQFGCCYNYAADRDGNPPGILQATAADPLPNLFKLMIKRLVRWHVLPTSCIPDSCIVNIYDPGDCIPPHIDSHDFVRPFSTVSFLSECNILFGSNLNIEGPGEFSGSTAIPLPVGSVLVLNGNGADVAKHCVPAVPTKRISITFRKMGESLHPIGFIPEPDLQNIQPLPDDSEHRHQHGSDNVRNFNKGYKYRGKPGTSPHQQPHGPETTPIMRPRQVINARSANSNSYNSMGRSRPYDSSSRSFSSSQGILRLPQQNQEWRDEGSSGHSHSEAGMDYSSNGRGRARLEQKWIVISRDIGGDEGTSNQNFERSRGRGPNMGRRRVRVALADDQ